MNNQSDNSPKIIEFLDRPFQEVEGGYWDGKGFYCTPDGSFWDEHGLYFNREGLDKHGGFYDEYTIYHPGPEWNEEYHCYKSEMNLDVEENIKEVITDNINEELNEMFNVYKNYFKEGDEEFEDDFSKNDDDAAEIFQQYIQNNLNNLDYCGIQTENILYHNNENYDKSNVNWKNNVNSLENSAAKNNIGSHIERVTKFDERNSKYEY